MGHDEPLTGDTCLAGKVGLPHARHIREKACAPEPSQPVPFLNLRNPPPIVRHPHGPFRGHQRQASGATNASSAEPYSAARLWSQTMRPASVGASAVRIKAALVRPETMKDIMRIWNLNELFRKALVSGPPHAGGAILSVP